jgi:UDP-glucuronate decarboxylase
MRTVLITGSTGFIGQNLIATLPEGLVVHTIPHSYLADPHKALPEADAIIHAAGYAAPAIFMANPLDTIKVNTVSVFRLFEESLKPGGSFLYCSSGEIYKGLEQPVTEEMIGTTTPYNPRAPYIEGKRCGEAIVDAYRRSGVRAISARIGLTYGPGTRRHDTRVVNQFIQKALTKRHIELMDNGAANIRMCYADDMAKMLWNVLLNGTQGLYNVGGIDDMTIAGLAMKIGIKTGALVSIPAGPVGVSQFKMDIQRYLDEFGTTAFTKLEDGLRETISYQRALYDV